MALVKTVELRILASAGDAQQKLDDLEAKAKALDGNAIKMRFRLDDAEGKAQLDRIQARARELGFKDVEIKVRVDGAGKAIAELQAVKAEAGRVGGNAFQGLLGRLFGLGAGGGPGEAAGGGLASVLGGPAAGVAGVGIAAGIGAILVELTGLVSGFAAAGAGAGAFYALAHPAINNLQGDIQALDKANQALGYAQQKYLIDPTKAHAKALHEAQVTYKAVYSQMGQDAGSAASSVLKLHDAYVKVTTAFQPQVFKILGDGAKVLTNALPALTPFANAFANALDPLLKKLATFTQSKGFADFIKQFSSLTGPAVTAIGEGIGKVANSIGKLLTTMNAADVSKSIGIAFNTIAVVINGVAGVIKRLMSNWDEMSSAAKTATHAVASAFDSMRSGVDTSIRGVESLVSALPGKIRGYFADAISWLTGAGKAIVQGLINGLHAMLGPLEGAVSAVVGAVKSVAGWLGIHSPSTVMFGYGQNIMQGLVAGIASGVPVLHGQLAGIAGMIARAARGAHPGVNLYPGVVNLGPQLADPTKFSAGGGIPYGGGDHIELHFHGVTTDQNTVKQMVQALREYKRHGGGQPLGIA